MKLQVTDRPSQFRLRRRTRSDGICTIEAAALTVMELAAERGERHDDAVIDALNLLNETVLQSTGKPPKSDDPSCMLGSGGGGAFKRCHGERAPRPPLRQPLAGGGNGGEESEFEDAQSSANGNEQEGEDDLVVFGSPEKGQQGENGAEAGFAFANSRDRQEQAE